jgi:serine/arginine repetitive matrix protein 1
MSKVKLLVLKPWIAKQITEILGFEDDVLIEYVYGQLETEVRLAFCANA